MLPTLLQTKLYIPQARATLVTRTRLLEKLNQAAQPAQRVILVSAPAGFGKTTLITQWINTLGWPVGWLSLDIGDNRPGRFFRYLIAALQKITPEAGQSILELLDSGHVDNEEIIERLANDLTALEQPFLIALDDYHNIHEPAIHQAVRLLLEALPAQGRLLLLSREDPPLPAARLRAHDQLVEIRPTDLRFSADECSAFLNQEMGLALTGEQIRALEERTEGWIAGLQMAALALETLTPNSKDSTPDSDYRRDHFIKAFSGSNRFILDYLVEEVLSRQQPDVQEFLMRTSIFERFNAGLCEAVLDSPTHRMNAQAMLEKLEQANLFVIALDNERCWYRYHHLFGDLLRARLTATRAAARAEDVTELHRRASAWFEQNNDPKSALEHALAAEDYQHAADLIDTHVISRWRDPDLDFFFSIDRLPTEVLHARPSLCLQSAWTCVITGQVRRVPALVEAAEGHLLPLLHERPDQLSDNERGMLAFARVLRAYLDDFANRPIHLDPSFEQAVQLVPEENIGMRNSMAVVLGTIYYMESDFNTAARFFQDAIERDQVNNGTNAVPIACTRWARMLMVLGRLREAERLLHKHERYVQERDARRFYVAGNLNILLGSLLREWNRLDEAEAQIRSGLKQHEAWPVPQAILMGHSRLAQVQIAQGSLNTAAKTIEHGLQIAQQSQIHPDIGWGFEAVQIQLWAAQKDWSALENWLDQHPPVDDQPLIFRYENQRINRAQAFIWLGREAQAIPILQKVAETAEACGRTGNQIEALSLLAACLPDEHALTYLKQAAQLAEPEGYLRVFLDRGPALIEQMKKLLAQTHESRLRDYLQKIIQASEIGPVSGEPVAPLSSGSSSIPINSLLVEPLSPRELEVMRLVAAGLSNQQIADRLVISVRTVKKHLENTYGKLGVDGRVQAIIRAKELSLL